MKYLIECMTEILNDKVAAGQEMVREKYIFKVKESQEIYFESGKIDTLRKCQGKLNYNTTHLILLKAGRSISSHC